MIPFLLGAVGCWFAPSLHALSIDLTVIWGSIILSFLGGVRRGFGFGNSGASTMVEILTMIVYVSIAGLALIFAGRWVIVSVCLLTFGYIIVPIADYRASRSGNAPDHFAALRPKQMSIAIVSLVAIVANLLVG